MDEDMKQDLLYIRKRIDSVHDKLSEVSEKKVDKEDHKKLEDRVLCNEKTLVKHKVFGSIATALLGFLGLKF